MKKILLQNVLLLLAFLLLAVMVPLTSFAISLDEAKAKGMVGEQTDGYLGVVTPSADANKLISDINLKRKDKYQEIANSNGTSLSAVEQLAAKKAIENTHSGHFVRLPDGSWKKK